VRRSRNTKAVLSTDGLLPLCRIVPKRSKLDLQSPDSAQCTNPSCYQAKMKPILRSPSKQSWNWCRSARPIGSRRRRSPHRNFADCFSARSKCVGPLQVLDIDGTEGLGLRPAQFAAIDKVPNSAQQVSCSPMSGVCHIERANMNSPRSKAALRLSGTHRASPGRQSGRAFPAEPEPRPIAQSSFCLDNHRFREDLKPGVRTNCDHPNRTSRSYRDTRTAAHLTALTEIGQSLA
jgi:hypothetical protein